MGPERISRGLVLLEPKFSNYPFKTFCIRNDPSGEGVFEKEDFMKDDEAQEISGKMRKERSYYPTR